MADPDHGRQPADVEDPLSAALSRLAAAVDLVEGWVATHGGEAKHHLDLSVYSLSLPIGEAIPGLRKLRQEDHEVTLTYEARGFLRVIQLRASGERVAPGKTGSWEESGLPKSRAAAVAAAERNGPWELLEALGSAVVEAEIKVRNLAAESGFYWIRERDALRAEYLGGTRWITLLYAAPPSSERPRLIVHDLSEGYVCARGLCVHGRGVEDGDLPSAPPARPDGESRHTPTEDTPSDDLREEAASDSQVLRQARVYADEWLQDDRRALPPPFLLEPVACHAGAADPEFLRKVQEWMHRAAQALTWIWLAETAAIGDGAVRFAWEGAAEVELRALDATPFAAEPEATRDAIRLWKMAVATEDDLRHESVHQAIEAIVRDPEDLQKAAVPVLRRARFVLKIAEENRTGEAMATLRAARQAAVEAASTIAAATRGAARSVVDRVFAAVVSALGVLLANKGDLINDDMAFWLLGAAGAVVAATWVIVYFVDYPDAEALHTAATRDLQRYRDLLDQTELEELTLGSLATAKKQLHRSRCISMWIVIGGMAVVLSMLLLVLAAAVGGG
ncbi:MAG: hypothetical protein SX243_25190 [Acidobacteriota bacterium]|nr:hypothetical protein [Acidobacteriota bacterium]